MKIDIKEYLLNLIYLPALIILISINFILDIFIASFKMINKRINLTHKIDNIKRRIIKNKLNEEILFRFLMDTAAEVQSAASKREPGMKIILYAFHSQDFDDFLINKNINLGKNKKKRLKVINRFMAKHYESNRIWMREEDTVNFNNFYYFQM